MKSAVLLSTLIFVTFLSAADEKGAHAYTIRVDGTEGVKLQMLLITKSTATSAPSRETKLITLPFKITVEATRFQVWFDTLNDGASGPDGARLNGSYLVDGEVGGAGFGGTLKKSNKRTFSFGNL